MTELELAWLAGFLDGEGSVNIGRMHQHGKVHYEAAVVVCNTHLETIERIQVWLGGKLTTRNEPERRKPCYYLGWYGARALEVAAMVVPFLVTKKRQADLLLQFPLGKHGVHHSPEQAGRELERERLYLELKQVKDAPAWRSNRKFSEASNSHNNELKLVSMPRA